MPSAVALPFLGERLGDDLDVYCIHFLLKEDLLDIGQGRTGGYLGFEDVGFGGQAGRARHPPIFMDNKCPNNQ